MLLLVVQTVVISLSGVIAPGPLTTTALAAGTRSRHAGAHLALGHGVVELPLMLLILAGLGTLLKADGVKMVVGLAALPASLGAGFLWDKIGLTAPFILSLGLTAAAALLLLFVKEKRACNQ